MEKAIIRKVTYGIENAGTINEITNEGEIEGSTNSINNETGGQIGTSYSNRDNRESGNNRSYGSRHRIEITTVNNNRK